MKMKRLYILLMIAAAFASCGKENGSKIPLPPDGEDEGGQGDNTSSLIVYGKVVDESGKPYAGVVMTDGTNFAVTGSDGKYEFEKNRYASYIQCSVPADAVISTGGAYNLANSHYKKLTSSTKEYNFIFTRQAVEKNFRILALGDPQVGSSGQVSRYTQTARADVQQYVVNSSNMKSYGITLGDNVNNEWGLLPDIAGVLGGMGLPVFGTIGNHDYEFPKEDDAEGRKKYEDVFGPCNFSFNRGDVHIIVFDNVLHGCSASGDYDQGYETWQYDWLEKDLSYVPKDKSIFMTMHIPLKDTKIMQLLSQYASAVVACGHTHKLENTYDKTVNGKKITICASGSSGAPWKGLILSDGCQRGYKVYEYEGSTLKRELYKSIQYEESFQMRMFRTTDFPSFTTPGGYVYGFPYYGANWIAVNVFNHRSGWEVSLWEDGVKTSSSPSIATSFDVWVKMFLFNKYNRDNDIGENRHILFFQLKNASASSIKVEAKDTFGNTYTCDKFTTSDDVPDYND